MFESSIVPRFSSVPRCWLHAHTNTGTKQDNLSHGPEKREKISYIWKLVDEHPVDESKPICKLQTHEDWPHIHNIPNFIVS